MKEIPVRARFGETLYALVDDEDYERLSAWKWKWNQTDKQVYRCVTPRTILLARDVLGLHRGDPWKVWHKDGNPLNNTRTNLEMKPTRKRPVVKKIKVTRPYTVSELRFQEGLE